MKFQKSKSSCKKQRQKEAKKALSKFSAVESLIEKKFMIVNHKNYHVAMLEELWNVYTGEKLLNFCDSLIFYCNMKNAFESIDVPEVPILTVSLTVYIKYGEDKVKTYCTYKNRKISFV